jgi:hypothetical protein
MGAPMRKLPLLTLCTILAACGDKVPESKAAREIGNMPKQVIDKAAAGVDAAVQQGMDRSKEEDKKQ